MTREIYRRNQGLCPCCTDVPCSLGGPRPPARNPDGSMKDEGDAARLREREKQGRARSGGVTSEGAGPSGAGDGAEDCLCLGSRGQRYFGCGAARARERQRGVAFGVDFDPGDPTWAGPPVGAGAAVGALQDALPHRSGGDEREGRQPGLLCCLSATPDGPHATHCPRPHKRPCDQLMKRGAGVPAGALRVVQVGPAK